MKRFKSIGHIVMSLALLISLPYGVNVLRSLFPAPDEQLVSQRLLFYAILYAMFLPLIYWLTKKAGLLEVNGLRPRLRFENPQALTVIVIFISIGGFFNLATFKSMPGWQILALLGIMIGVGLSEEWVFRGIILPSIIRLTKNIWVAALLSSVLFGVFHFMVLIDHPEAQPGIIGQVISSFCAGIFFAGLYLRTGSILAVVIIHGLFDFVFASSMLITLWETGVRNMVPAPSAGYTANMFMSYFFLGALTLGGLFMIWHSDVERIRAEVQSPIH